MPMKEKIADPAQFALLSKTCYGAVLSKVLFLDICQETRTESGFGKADCPALIEFYQT